MQPPSLKTDALPNELSGKGVVLLNNTSNGSRNCYLGLDVKASGVRSTGWLVCVESARGAVKESLLS